MTKNQIDNLRNRVRSNKDSAGKQSELTPIIELVRGLGCLSDIIGRDFEIRNPKGKLVYTIRQKPIKLKQLNVLLEEFNVVQKLEAERESSKWGGGKKSKMGRRK